MKTKRTLKKVLQPLSCIKCATALIVSGLLGYNLYEDATTIDDNALKIEVTTFSNPTDSGMDSARDQLPEHIVKLIDKSEMGSVI